LRLDPNLAEAHSAYGAILLFDEWDWEAAERELNLAIKLNPNMILNRPIHGFCLAAQGRFPEALATLRQGQQLDPLAAPRTNELAMCYNAMRRHKEATVEAQKAIELDPNFALPYGELGLAYIQENKHTEAIQELRAAVERGKGHPRSRGLLGYAYAVAGQKAEALKELQALLADGRFGRAFAIARIQAALGENTEAIKWLRQALDERESLVIWLKFDPTLDNLRTDPRFKQMLKEMRLPP
jgi:tetratricopeptide (TPR) repeat protein